LILCVLIGWSVAERNIIPADDFVDWTTSDGQALLTLVNELFLPALPGAIQGAGEDPFTLSSVAGSSTNIGIGTASYGLNNLRMTGINSVQPFANFTAASTYVVQTVAPFTGFDASLDVSGQVQGAVQSVCIPIIGCHDIPLPPLFGQTVSVSGTLTSHMDSINVLVQIFLQVDPSQIDFSDPNSLKKATAAAKVQVVNISIGNISASISGFNDPIIGQPLTNLVVGAFQSQIAGLIESNASGPITSALNNAIYGVLGHN